ncbi:hypothetical protein ORV05_31065 [Amycolatopsis cynarae]|uniref:ABC3 transporter permease C-terminal domain-containing protein n=1 Tax=Amycolatopsis cynarae TaxID=2995223 RepID=A0ABY7AZ47_9PSEU|nr:FtsX-like permease family protein [Amycolatopsis sp. HUAS 11-8]WAL65297.1 hypothetical protein ORV05_31065 [Amycolatopsis sp. HUAS 11-8]
MNLIKDLLLGARLAIGSGRTLKPSLLRLALSTAGIGLATTMLFLLVTAASAIADRGARIDAREPAEVGAAEGSGAALYLIEQPAGDAVTVRYVEPAGPGAPVPPGLSALPATGEMVVSPALAGRLAADPGLAARFPYRLAGTVGPAGLAGPDELWAYVGSTGLRDSPHAERVIRFGGNATQAVPPQLAMLGAIAVLVLLVPMLVFVASASRIAGAEQDRRLSALRLAGAAAAQVRRIATGESLVGAVAGVVLGTLLFLVVRPFAAGARLAGILVFPQDFVPGWALALCVVAVIPAITVASAWFGLRGLIVEPLSVMRRARPPRRRLWWRLLVVVLGVAMLVPDKLFGVADRPADVLPFILGGTVLLLIGIPALLPWVTEYVVGRIRGGFPAWQLAVRRLQLDSGTPSRVVGGIAVVLASIISLHTLLGSVYEHARAAGARDRDPATVTVEVEASALEQAAGLLQGVRGVRSVDPQQWVYLRGETAQTLLVASCSYLRARFQVGECADGDAYALSAGLTPGTTLRVDGSGSRLVVPAGTRPLQPRPGEKTWIGLLATPGAVRGADLPTDHLTLELRLDPAVPGALAGVRQAVSVLGWRASVSTLLNLGGLSEDSFLAALRDLLYVGAIFTLLLAGGNLLVTVTGQLTERRRPLAAMNAAGVPLGVLGRSLLWQNALPVVFGVLLAVGAGVGLAALMLRLTTRGAPFLVDGTFALVIGVVAVLLVLGVTAASLPVLRSATKLEALRAE